MNKFEKTKIRAFVFKNYRSTGCLFYRHNTVLEKFKLNDSKYILKDHQINP